MADLMYFASKGIITNGDKILVLYSYFDGKKTWDFPGGRSKKGEDPETTLIREVKEETGLEIIPMHLIDTWHYTKEKFHVSGVFYQCVCDQFDITISDEHDGFEWISFEDITEKVQSKPYISRIKNWTYSNGKYTKAEIKNLKIDQLIPNNLYLNQSKIDHVEACYHNKENDQLPPVLVTMIEGAYALIDGHSRTYVAYKKGHDVIDVMFKPLEEISGPKALYESIHTDALSLGIKHIGDLEHRRLSKDAHKEKWVGYCKARMEALNL
jgi:8-oxo-dGTP diphosphatase